MVSGRAWPVESSAAAPPRRREMPRLNLAVGEAYDRLNVIGDGRRQFHHAVVTAIGSALVFVLVELYGEGLVDGVGGSANDHRTASGIGFQDL